MKKNKISENELSKSANVSLRMIKKLKKGVVVGNFNSIERVCKELEISVNQLFMAKKYLSQQEENESLVKIVKHYKNKAKQLYCLMFLIPLVLILLTIFICVKLYQNRDFAYELNGNSQNFAVNHLMFMRDNGYYYLYPGNFEIKNSNISEETIISISLMSEQRLIYSSNRYVRDISIEKKGYNELFPNEVAQNVDNWYFKIEYSINEDIKIELIKLELKDLNK